MKKYKELTTNDMAKINGGNAAGNAVLGGLSGFSAGMKFCKIPHPVLKGVCVVGFTAGSGYLAYKAN
ncbi:Blp family class II bacteriocin [Streptococcus pluranimalium]|uniref:Blp family class II bacteriocin n=1 Tax=Streptococcus pluranimalium TaxID=82348 RepID=UPI003F679418